MTITERIDAVTKIPQSHRLAAPPAPRSVKIELTGRCNYRCLRGDTPVDTIYGPIPIRDLAERYSSVPVYTYRDGEVFVSDAVNIRKYGSDEELVRVHFDDGTHIDCTPDHRFLTFHSRGAAVGTDEQPMEARHLTPGTRLRAFRENAVGGGYINICAGRTFRKKRYRLVMEYLLGRPLLRSEIVHHRDRDRMNDRPENLQIVGSSAEHAGQHPERAERMRRDNPRRNMTPQWAAKIRAGLIGKRRTLEQRLRYRASKLGALNPNYRGGEPSGRSRIAEVNHKVVRVERLQERDDVYCLDVPATGWFFANKVLVKNCGFCALRTREKQPDGDMDLDLFRTITTDMRVAGVEEIGLFYLGESFMAPELLLDALKWVKGELGFPYVFLTSNASLSQPEHVERLMQHGLDSLKWSVNAADEQQFREVMGVSAKYWRKALGHIRDAFELRNAFGYSTRLYASSIRYDGEQQAKMEALLATHVLPYVDQHYWLPLYSMGAIATQREAELGYRPTAGNQGRLDAMREPLPCWSAFTEGHVRADGGLSLCCFDSDGRFQVGDLTRQSFMEAWNSPEFQAIRAAHLRRDVSGTVCEQCVAYAS